MKEAASCTDTEGGIDSSGEQMKRLYQHLEERGSGPPCPPAGCSSHSHIWPLLSTSSLKHCCWQCRHVSSPDTGSCCQHIARIFLSPDKLILKSDATLICYRTHDPKSSASPWKMAPARLKRHQPMN